jgi:hypothetical protein
VVVVASGVVATGSIGGVAGSSYLAWHGEGPELCRLCNAGVLPKSPDALSAVGEDYCL